MDLAPRFLHVARVCPRRSGQSAHNLNLGTPAFRGASTLVVIRAANAGKRRWLVVKSSSKCNAIHVLALAISACSGSPGPTDTVGSAQAKLSPALPGGERLGLVRRALESVPLRPDQKTETDRLILDATTRHERLMTARLALGRTIAGQVRAGVIDRSVMEHELDAFKVAAREVRIADIAALGRLHDVLDAPERSKLVDALEDGLSAEHGRHGKLRSMRQWATELGLTDTQIARIMASMPAEVGRGEEPGRANRRWGREALHATLEAFRGDRFTVDENVTGALTHSSERRAGKVLDALLAATPVLTPAQRELAAQRILAQGTLL
jgi:Spy/CpxP family protein refolding chaperone